MIVTLRIPPCTWKGAEVVEVPPPGDGLLTVTGKVPSICSAEDGTVAVSCEADTKVGVTGVVPKITVDAGVKLLPSMVIVIPAEFTFAELGEIEVTDGRGYDNETEAEAEIEVSAWLVAVIVTFDEPEGIMAGAV
jgi:hypothetical protein